MTRAVTVVEQVRSRVALEGRGRLRLGNANCQELKVTGDCDRAGWKDGPPVQPSQARGECQALGISEDTHFVNCAVFSRRYNIHAHTEIAQFDWIGIALMQRSVPSNANPQMLKWAREFLHLSIDDVAQAEKITVEQLRNWENGNGTPTLAMLRRLGKRYKRPLMVFYLQDPPPILKFNIVKDFRSLPAGVASAFSPELIFAIRSAQERQAWAGSFLEDEGVDENEHVGSITVSSKIEVEAANLRRLLGITLTDQGNCASDFDAWKLWRTRSEKAGFYVFQSTRVGLDEMRGCALPHPRFPVALINSKDYYVARIFTLVHELVHILLGESAVTDTVDHSPVRKIEKFCNRFASEALVPRNDFSSRMPGDWMNRDDEVIRRAATAYRVSRAVIGIRLVETGFATKAYLDAKWPYLQSQ